ncbi:glycosyltransferase [Nonomuraea ferruginea]
MAVGRLAPRKQPVGLLRILEKARARVPAAIPLRATVVGDGPARPAMERYLARHGMSGWVSLPGRYSRERIAKVLESADVFVAPAPRESFGIAALEARTAGLPVVARTQSGVADFVEHGTEGLLGRDPGAVAEAVARLCEDRGLRERITRHNRANPPAAGSWPTVLAGFDRAYAEAAEPRLRVLSCYRGTNRADADRPESGEEPVEGPQGAGRISRHVTRRPGRGHHAARLRRPRAVLRRDPRQDRPAQVRLRSDAHRRRRPQAGRPVSDGHCTLTGHVPVPLPPPEALRLFTPRGEEEWIKGWRPRFPVPAPRRLAARHRLRDRLPRRAHDLGGGRPAGGPPHQLREGDPRLAG